VIGDERGTAALELTLGLCVLVLPLVMLVSALPTWLERDSVTRAIAREAARSYVVASDPAAGVRAAGTIADRIATNHGLTPQSFSLNLDGELDWGSHVTVTVRTVVPLLWLPGIGHVGGFTISAHHREVVDPYRSF